MVTSDREGHYYQGNIAIMNNYAPSTKIPEYIKQTLLELK